MNFECENVISKTRVFGPSSRPHKYLIEILFVCSTKLLYWAEKIIASPTVLHTYTSIQTQWCLWSITQTIYNIQVRQTWKCGWWKSKFGSDAREFLSHKINFKTLMISWRSDKRTLSVRSLSKTTKFSTSRLCLRELCASRPGRALASDWPADAPFLGRPNRSSAAIFIHSNLYAAADLAKMTSLFTKNIVSCFT